MKEAFVFEVGKCYEHNTGKRIHIIAEAELDIYFSPCLIAETDSGGIIPVGKSEESAVNYHEITREEWLNTFKSSFVSEVEAEYGNGWIPCSERLPGNMQQCLTTAKIYFVPDHVDEPNNYIGLELNTYSEKFGWLQNPNVIAWMPLPEEYKPGKGE